MNHRLHGLNRLTRIILILVIGITAIGVTAWITKPMELPSDVIIIRPLPIEDNPYQKEYDEMLSPCVRIETLTGVGSGVIIPHRKDAKDAKGYVYILTAGHVVGNYANVDVTFYSYSKEGTNPPERLFSWAGTLNASVVMTDTAKDLALLEIRNPKSEIRNWATAKLAPRNYQPYLFSPVWVVGCSLGLNPRPSSGCISVIGGFSWEISAPVLPGNSGGPVYDAGTHELIGIAVWVRLYGDQLVTTMAGIVPINVIYEFLEAFNRKDAKALSNS